MENLNDVVVANVMGQPVTRGELEAAFNLVANAGNWKAPITAAVVLDERGRAVTAEAVTFFTGSRAKFTQVRGDLYVVEAAGYYRTIGA